MSSSTVVDSQAIQKPAPFGEDASLRFIEPRDMSQFLKGLRPLKVSSKTILDQEPFRFFVESGIMTEHRINASAE